MAGDETRLVAAPRPSTRASRSGLVLSSPLWVLGAQYADRGKQITALQAKLEAGPLHAPAKTRSITIKPARNGPSGGPSVNLQVKGVPGTDRATRRPFVYTAECFSLHDRQEESGPRWEHLQRAPRFQRRSAVRLQHFSVDSR